MTPTDNPNPGKRWHLILLAALVALVIGGVFAYRFAIRTVEEKIVAALGAQGEVRELKVGLTGVEMKG